MLKGLFILFGRLIIWPISWPILQAASEGNAHGAPSRIEVRFGGPCRSRTYDQEIKSLLLYQLS